MYCRYCGCKNNDDAKFCGACGREINTFYNYEALEQDNDINVVLSESQASIKPREVLEEGFFFKGLDKPYKLSIYAFGIFLAFLTASIVFTIFFPEYIKDLISYMSRFMI